MEGTPQAAAIELRKVATGINQHFRCAVCHIILTPIHFNNMKKTVNAPTPLIMTESYWRNSQLSIARFFGNIKYNGHRYIIVDKLGRDLFECAKVAEREGRDNAIEPGEPADLILDGLQPHYRRLGRDRILTLMKEGKKFEDIAKTKE